MQDSRAVVGLVIIGTAVISVYLGLFIVSSSDLVIAVITGLTASLISLIVVSQNEEDRVFIIRLWLGALALRVLVGFTIYNFGLGNRLGPDWATYDFFGSELARYWREGGVTGAAWIVSDMARYRSGWGMYYFVAAIYYITGTNPLATQLICCVFGANTCVLIYRIARMVYPVQHVARLAAILATLSPSLIIWCSQGLKEPLIVFLLAACLFLTLRSTQRHTVTGSILLLLCMSGLYALRHYVFYVVFLGVAASLLFAARQFSPQRIIQGSAAVLFLGFVFAYYGAGDVATRNFDLQRLQAGREWSAKWSESGYGGDVDITDTRQALVYLPLGTVFFLFAPFPWMIRNFNHLITLPEMIVWWAAAPFLFWGFWYSFRRRLRPTLAICLFTTGLTLAYALYLTNFGTAHRMRVQILGFFIIFVCIGWHQFQLKRQGRRSSAPRLSRIPVRLAPAVAGQRQLQHVRDRGNH
jgi:Dolichyl-phosphate-mannose-protein mannosyltransferase